MDFPLVIVEWQDAWSDEANFATAHGVKSTHEPMVVRTLGYVLVDDETGISVVAERSVQDGHDVFRGRTFIPRAMVKSVTPYKLSKPRRIRERAGAQATTPV